MTDFDRASLDRVLPATPGPADWDDVMGRAGGHDGRRRVLVLAVAAFVVALGTASAFGTVRDFFLETGFIGLPPIGATPSAPESGELVVSLRGRPAPLGGLLNEVWVYADGRMIWQREGGAPQGANELTSGMLEQRLTSEGVERLRSEIVSTGLFDHDLSLLTEQGFVDALQVRAGDRLVRVHWVNLAAVDAGKLAGTIATPTQVRALERVEALLTDPAAWLPANAWKDRRIRAYVPSGYAVCWSGWPPEPIEPSQALALLPASVQNLLRARGSDRGPFGGSPVEDCSSVTTEEARAIAEALDDAGLERSEGAHRLAYRFEAPGPNTYMVHTYFEPRLPDGEFTCTPCG